MPVINYNSPSSRQGAQRSFQQGRDYRSQGLGLLRRGQDMQILDFQSKKDALNNMLFGIAQQKAQHEAAQKQRAQSSGGFFGSGGGTALGTGLGVGLGAILAAPTGGLSMLAGAGLGGVVGGAGGVAVDAAFAPGAGSTQGVQNLPGNLMNFSLMQARLEAMERLGQQGTQEDVFKGMGGDAGGNGGGYMWGPGGPMTPEWQGTPPFFPPGQGGPVQIQ